MVVYSEDRTRGFLVKEQASRHNVPPCHIEGYCTGVRMCLLSLGGRDGGSEGPRIPGEEMIPIQLLVVAFEKLEVK